MKNVKRIIVEEVCWISLILVFIANLVPVLFIEQSGFNPQVNLYLIDLLSIGSVENGISFISFYGVLLITLLIVCPILLMNQNKIAKKIGFGLSLALFATVIYYTKVVNNIVENNTSHASFKAGIIILLIAYILILICSIFVIVDDMYGESIKKIISTSSKQSLKELLEENEKLYTDKLITEEEYRTRRENLINRG